MCGNVHKCIQQVPENIFFPWIQEGGRSCFSSFESCSNDSYFTCRFQGVMQHTQPHTSKLVVPGPTSPTGPLLFPRATYRDDCIAKTGALELSESLSQEASEAICSSRRLTTVLFVFVRRVWQQNPFNIELEDSRAPWCYSIVDVALIYNMANG